MAERVLVSGPHLFRGHLETVNRRASLSTSQTDLSLVSSCSSFRGWQGLTPSGNLKGNTVQISMLELALSVLNYGIQSIEPMVPMRLRHCSAQDRSKSPENLHSSPPVARERHIMKVGPRPAHKQIWSPNDSRRSQKMARKVRAWGKHGMCAIFWTRRS